MTPLTTPPQRVFVATGDASGDAHGRGVIEALLAQNPKLEIQAIGGWHIEQTGVTLFHRQEKLGAFGTGFIKAIPGHLRLAQKLIEHFKTWTPDAVLLIDYGGFNLRLADALRKRFGTLKIYYYIPPQLWASRPGRVQYLQRAVNHVFCIFPFELPFYQRHGVSASFVGHPLVGSLPPAPDRQTFCQTHRLDANRPIVGVFPGSRPMEIKYLLQPMIKALPLIQSAYAPQLALGMQPLQFVLARSSAISDELFNTTYNQVASLTDRLSFRVLEHENHAILALSQAALVASGTVTLEAALYGTPVVLTYNGPWLAKLLFRHFCKLPYVGLPNILTEHPPIVPEYLMEHLTPYNLCEGMMPFLQDTETRQTTITALQQIQQTLGQSNAAQTVANGILNPASLESMALAVGAS